MQQRRPEAPVTPRLSARKRAFSAPGEPITALGQGRARLLEVSSELFGASERDFANHRFWPRRMSATRPPALRLSPRLIYAVRVVAGAAPEHSVMIARPLGKRDYDHLVQVILRCWGQPIGNEMHPIHPVFYHELGSLALVAERSGNTLGILLAFRNLDEPCRAYVHLVAVHPDHRRRGIGTVLYQALEERCLNLGCTVLRATAAVHNEAATRFHESNGWRTDHVPDYAGPARPRHLFTKALTPT